MDVVDAQAGLTGSKECLGFAPFTALFAANLYLFE